jgi:hypothetical protein
LIRSDRFIGHVIENSRIDITQTPQNAKSAIATSVDWQQIRVKNEADLSCFRLLELTGFGQPVILAPVTDNAAGYVFHEVEPLHWVDLAMG